MKVVSVRLTFGETNCLTEPLFESAVERARELDQYYRKFGKLVGPLHGIPISLKDQFNIAGVDTTFGYIGRAFQPASEDAPMTKTLKDLGAVIITKTNVPQTILVSILSHAARCHLLTRYTSGVRLKIQCGV